MTQKTGSLPFISKHTIDNTGKKKTDLSRHKCEPRAHWVWARRMHMQPKMYGKVIYKRICGMQSKHQVPAWLLTVYILSWSSTEQSTYSCKHTMLSCVSWGFFKLLCWNIWGENVNVCGLRREKQKSFSGPTIQPHSSKSERHRTNADMINIKSFVIFKKTSIPHKNMQD